MQKIKIVLFGPLIKACGCKNMEMEFEEESLSLNNFKNKLLQTFPQLQKFSFTIAINQTVADKNSTVKKDDEVALLPPISGGNIKYLTSEKITDDYIIKLLNTPDNTCGALLTFRGIVRADTRNNTQVTKINYSAYDSMAEKKIADIVNYSIKRFKLIDVIVKHRTGKVDLGETAFFVAVFSSHRKEGIKAIDFIIDEVKKKVPVWKEEIYSDGSSEFKSGQPIK